MATISLKNPLVCILTQMWLHSVNMQCDVEMSNFVIKIELKRGEAIYFRFSSKKQRQASRSVLMDRANSIWWTSVMYFRVVLSLNGF